MPASAPTVGRLPLVPLLAAVAVGLLMLLPLLFVVGTAVDIGASESVRLIVRPRVGELLWNTTRLAVGAMLACAVLGTGAAWLVERTTVPGRRALTVLLAAPLAIPAFVNSYAWVSLLPSAAGFWGALLIVTLSYFPFVYLPVAAALRGLDPAHEETARSLGRGAFLRIVLPLLRPAMLGGVLLVGLHLLAEFGALQLLRFPTFTTAIYDQYQSTFNGPAASMLAGVLVLCCLVLLVAETRLRGRARYLARSGSGSPRPPDRVRLGGWTPPAMAALAALVALSLAVPLVSLGYWLIEGSSTTLDIDQVLTATGTTLGLGAAGALVTTLAAVPVAWLYVRRHGRTATLLERVTYTGSALPGIVIALALVTITIRTAPGLYQTVVVVVVAYLILFLPRAMVNVRATLAQVPPVYEDIAHSLGLGRAATWRRVTLPLIAPGLGAGTALVFLGVVTELTATLLLAPTGTQTLATQFWSYSSSIAYGAAAPYATLMVLISAPATYLLTRELRRESAP